MNLHVKIINPTYSSTFKKLKSYQNRHINIEIDYYNKEANGVIKKDLEDKDIGLIVVSDNFFTKNISLLYASRVPVFKTGTHGFLNLKEGVVLSNNSEDIEQESAVIFDISAQLDLKIKLYNFNPDNSSEKNSLAEHFNNLSKLFSQKVEIVTTKKNPLIKLRSREDILQFVPFNDKIKESSLFSIFSTDMEKLHFKLSSSYQLFIPTQAQR